MELKWFLFDIISNIVVACSTCCFFLFFFCGDVKTKFDFCLLRLPGLRPCCDSAHWTAQTEMHVVPGESSTSRDVRSSERHQLWSFKHLGTSSWISTPLMGKKSEDQEKYLQSIESINLSDIFVYFCNIIWGLLWDKISGRSGFLLLSDSVNIPQTVAKWLMGFQTKVSVVSLRSDIYHDEYVRLISHSLIGIG